MQTNPTPEQWAKDIAVDVLQAWEGHLADTFIDGIALTIQAAFAEREARLVADMQAIMDYFKTDDGNAPGHSHLVPGVWDKDSSNGAKGGTKCEWCEQWNNARATLAALKDRTHG